MEIIDNKEQNELLKQIEQRESHIRGLKWQQMWGRQFSSVLQEIIDKYGDDVSVLETKVTQDILKKAAYAAVQFINLSCEDDDYVAEKTKEVYDWIQAALQYLGALTIENLVQTFPITKDYDGERWYCKDYFSTMADLQKYDWKQPIGADNVYKFLWDYHNDDLGEFTVHYTSVISAMYRDQTGKSMVEQFLDEVIYREEETPAAGTLPEGWEFVGKDAE